VTAPARSLPGVPVPPSVQTVGERVERRLRAVLDDEIARWSALDADLARPLESLGRLVLGGGKRLRPAFCHWGHVGAGGAPDDPRVIDAGAAFELLHAFALVHDDVMDGSALRRGAPTAHVDFAGEHVDGSWRGEARRFGEGVAILIGDLAHVYADRLLRGAPPQALDVWDELRIELNVGQYLDVLGTARRDADRVRARRIARYKSGKYTVERPLHLGAALAGRLDDLRGPLSAYGDPLGEAFQLRDDVLGAFGDEAITGKPVGDDLREGKPTPLLAAATERAGRADGALLGRVGDRDLDGDAVAELQALLVDTGALAEIEGEIDRLTATAIGALDDAPITDEAKVALVELARFVAWRER
jgi:geranylgeranyl diphosphate synthase, type I